MLEFRKTLIRRIKLLLKKTPHRLVLFIVKLLNGLFSSCLWRNSGCFLLFSFFFFFFISNITAICENKIPPSSESAMISKELENSNLSYFSANLTDIFFFKLSPNIVGKLSPNIIKNCYLSFSGNPQSFSIILRLFDVLPNYHFL